MPGHGSPALRAYLQALRVVVESTLERSQPGHEIKKALESHAKKILDLSVRFSGISDENDSTSRSKSTIPASDIPPLHSTTSSTTATASRTSTNPDDVPAATQVAPNAIAGSGTTIGSFADDGSGIDAISTAGTISEALGLLPNRNTNTLRKRPPMMLFNDDKAEGTYQMRSGIERNSFQQRQ
jgi:hypothetical protein